MTTWRNLVTNPRGRDTRGTVVVVPDYRSPERMAVLEAAIGEYTAAEVRWSSDEPDDEAVIWVDPVTGVAREWNPQGWEYAENLALNPAAVEGGYPWTVQGHSDAEADYVASGGPTAVPTYARYTFPGGGGWERLRSYALVEPGTTYEVRVWARVIGEVGFVNLQFQGRTAEDNGTLQDERFSTRPTPREWTEIVETVTTEPGVYLLRVSPELRNLGPEGAEVHATGLKVSEVPGPYGDGDSPGWQWDGTPHASASHRPAREAGWWSIEDEGVVAAVQAYQDYDEVSPDPDLELVDGNLIAPAPVGVTPTRGVAYYSNRNDAVALRVGDGSNNAYAIGPSPTGLNGRVSVATEVWTEDGRPVRLRSYFTSETGVEQWVINGRETIRSSAYNPSIFIGLYIHEPDRTVYYRPAVVPGDYEGPYFDGDSELDDKDYFVNWEGLPHKSPSIMSLPVPDGWTYEGDALLYYSQSYDMLAVKMPRKTTQVSSVYPTAFNPEGEHTLLVEYNNPSGEPWINQPEVPGQHEDTRLIPPNQSTRRITVDSVESGWKVIQRDSDLEGNDQPLYFRVLATPGEYEGGYFDGSTEDREEAFYRWLHSWENSEDDSVSFRTQEFR